MRVAFGGGGPVEILYGYQSFREDLQGCDVRDVVRIVGCHVLDRRSFEGDDEVFPFAHLHVCFRELALAGFGLVGRCFRNRGDQVSAAVDGVRKVVVGRRGECHVHVGARTCLYGFYVVHRICRTRGFGKVGIFIHVAYTPAGPFLRRCRPVVRVDLDFVRVVFVDGIYRFSFVDRCRGGTSLPFQDFSEHAVGVGVDFFGIEVFRRCVGGGGALVGVALGQRAVGVVFERHSLLEGRILVGFQAFHRSSVAVVGVRNVLRDATVGGVCPGFFRQVSAQVVTIQIGVGRGHVFGELALIVVCLRLVYAGHVFETIVAGVVESPLFAGAGGSGLSGLLGRGVGLVVGQREIRACAFRHLCAAYGSVVLSVEIVLLLRNAAGFACGCSDGVITYYFATCSTRVVLGRCRRHSQQG